MVKGKKKAESLPTLVPFRLEAVGWASLFVPTGKACGLLPGYTTPSPTNSPYCTKVQ
jgi:hypothetical protein